MHKRSKIGEELRKVGRNTGSLEQSTSFNEYLRTLVGLNV